MPRCPEHRPFREVRLLYLEASAEDQDRKAAWEALGTSTGN